MKIKTVLSVLIISVSLIILFLASLQTALVSKASQPVNFYVDTTADGSDADLNDGLCLTSANACTLRAAIQQANHLPGADTINFVAPGTYSLFNFGSGEDNAASGDLDIYDDLTIIGTGDLSQSTVIDGLNLDRIFDVFSGTVTLTNLTIQNGQANNGGGIRSVSDLNLMNITLAHNNATNNGGGVYVSTGQVLFEGGDVFSNTAQNNGGGFFLTKGSSMTQTGSSIHGNTATADGGGIYLSSSDAATKNRLGLAIASESTFELMSGSIGQNEARNGGGIFVFQSMVKQQGGQITGNQASTWGGGVHLTAGQFEQHAGSVMSNTANLGGGFYVFQGTIDLIQGQVNHNHATNHGGGLFVANNSFFNQNGGSIELNTAVRDGGGVYVSQGEANLDSGQILGNSALNGGGIYISDGSFDYANGTISNNQATNGGGVYIRDGFFTQVNAPLQFNTATYGGGVYVRDGEYILDNSLVENNTASYGGAIYILNGVFIENGAHIKYNKANSFGGGIYLADGNATLKNGTIFSNTTSSGGGGGIYVQKGQMNLNNEHLTTNIVTSGDGGGLFNRSGTIQITASVVEHNQTNQSGGGIYLDKDGHLTLQNVTIQDNIGNSTGGGIYVSGILTQTNTQIERNVAQNGGGIYLTQGIVTQQTGTLKDNESTLYGGAAYISSGIFNQTNGFVYHNTAAGDGGGFYQRGGLVNLTATIIENNDSGYQGGGLYIEDGVLIQDGGQIFANTSGYNGGGIYIGDQGVVTLTQTAVDMNTTVNQGGGVYINRGTFYQEGGKINRNTAGYGGGLFALKGGVTLDRSLVADNQAINGGGIYAENESTVTIIGTFIEDNTANLLGGGFYNNTSEVFILETTLRRNRASSGGAIYTVLSDKFTLGATTVSRNTTFGNTQAGSISIISGQVTMVNTTISGNTTPDGQAGGIFVTTGTLVLTNTTIATHTAPGLYVAPSANNVILKNTLLAQNQPNCVVEGAAFSKGNNLSDDTSCNTFLTFNGDITDTDSQIAPLGNYGGRQNTHALLELSPAIDAADTNACSDEDARGIFRPQGPGCDIGAYEFDEPRQIAVELTENDGVTDTLADNTEIKWYKVDVPIANSTFTVTLSGLSQDYDLYLFAPDFDEEVSQFRDLGYDIGFLGYDIGFLGYDIGFLGYDIGFLGYDIGFLGYDIGFLTSNADDLADSSQVTANSLYEDICDNEAKGLFGNVGETGDLNTLICVSASPGTTSEVVATQVQGLTGTYYVAVTGRASKNADRSYTIQTEIELPAVYYEAITHTVHTTYTTPLTDTTVETLILYNGSRLNEFYTQAKVAQLATTLETLRSHNQVNGKLINLDDYEPINFAYDVWDAQPDNPFAANFVAVHIKQLIYDLRPAYPNIEYLVVIGNDEIIPHYRVEDENVYANEYTYASIAATERISGALASRHFLSDDYYAGIIPLPWRSRELYLPHLAIGRLVENPDEMIASINAFLAQPTISPGNALVTGYDFVTDQAEYIESALSEQGITVDSLINDTWTVDDLRQKLFTVPDAHHLNSINGHFNHFQTFPISPTAVVSASEVTDDVNYQGSIIFTVGCHSALNVPDADSPIPARGNDWAQAFLRQGGVFIGNTGYGYGHYQLIGYSEKIMTNFVDALSYIGEGPQTVGKALVDAKHRYFNSALSLTTYDEKVIEQTILYGLPMLGVNMPTQTTVPPGGRNIAMDIISPAQASRMLTGTITTPLEPFTGTIALSLTYKRNTNDQGIYYTIDSASYSQGTLSNPTIGDVHMGGARPLQPRISYDIYISQTMIHGVLMTGGDFSDGPSFNPSVTRLITDELYSTLSTEPTYPTSQWYPIHVATINRFLRIKGNAQTRLVIVPGQFQTDDESLNGPETSGIQRLYDSLELEVYYQPLTNTDYIAPSIWDIEVISTTGTTSATVDVTFKVEVEDDIGDVTRAILLYQPLNVSKWYKVELSYNYTSDFAIAQLKDISKDGFYYFVQAVDDSGNVALALDHGEYFFFGELDDYQPIDELNHQLYIPIILKSQPLPIP